MKNALIRFWLSLLIAFFPQFVAPQDLLIRNATILTVTKGTIPKGDILILKGIIKEIGEDIEAPKGLRIIDATGKFATPGLIDSHNHIGISEINEKGETISSEVNVRDVIDAEDIRIFYCLTGGVTMVHSLHGSRNPIGGQNVTLKMKWGKSAEKMLVPQAYRTIKFAQGENVKQSIYNPPSSLYPKSRMGVVAIVRRNLLKARAYMAEWNRYEIARKVKNDLDILPPKRDLQMETLADVLRGKILVRCHAFRADEIMAMVNLSKELGFKIACFEHASEAFKIAKELAAEGIGISVFSYLWPLKIEVAEGIPYNAAFCTKHGVLVSLNSDSMSQMQYMFNEAALTMKFGSLSADEALKLITINPAIQLGVDKIVGSLEVGKHGDIALFNKQPMDSATRCEMTIIEGEVYFDRDKYHRDREAKMQDVKKQKIKEEN